MCTHARRLWRAAIPESLSSWTVFWVGSVSGCCTLYGNTARVVSIDYSCYHCLIDYHWLIDYSTLVTIDRLIWPNLRQSSTSSHTVSQNLSPHLPLSSTTSSIVFYLYLPLSFFVRNPVKNHAIAKSIAISNYISQNIGLWKANQTAMLWFTCNPKYFLGRLIQKEGNALVYYSLPPLPMADTWCTYADPR